MGVHEDWGVLNEFHEFACHVQCIISKYEVYSFLCMACDSYISAFWPWGPCHTTPCQLYVCMSMHILIMNVHSTCRSRAKNVGDKIIKITKQVMWKGNKLMECLVITFVMFVVSINKFNLTFSIFPNNFPIHHYPSVFRIYNFPL